MKILDFFKRHHLDLKGKKLLVAASAGPDSMALLDILRRLAQQNGFIVIAAHFNHQLRPDSKNEGRLLTKYCQQQKIALFEGKWPKQRHPSTGIEAAARRARYAFLTRIARQEQADYLLTAHHGDDLLENILLKFIRSGNPEEMNSLQAVGQMQGITLLRPLLSYSKQELLAYDRVHQIQFIWDTTNSEDNTMRNRLRHHVVPLLKKENPLLIQNALRFSQKLTLLTNFATKNLTDIGEPQPFLNWVYRLPAANLAKLTVAEQKIYWQQIIWLKYRRRVNQNLGGFTVVLYQNYFYLFAPHCIHLVDPFSIKLDHEFAFQGRHFILSRENKLTASLCGDFYFETEDSFKVGSLIPGSRLLLKNGQHVKAKKEFAVSAIPAALRPLCLTIYAHQRPVFIEKTYQNQNQIQDSQHYFLYTV